MRTRRGVDVTEPGHGLWGNDTRPAHLARGLRTGQMARGERALVAALTTVNVVWEVVDARCPRASRNPRLARLCAGKPLVIVLAKADLAEPVVSAKWVRYLDAEAPVVVANLRRPSGIRALAAASREAQTRVGAHGSVVGFDALVAGVPNTGKSTLLNLVTGGAHAAVGARPGITRGAQWLRVPAGGRVLDLPGVLPPRLDSWPVIWRLWAVGAVTLDAADAERAGNALADWITGHAPLALSERYGLLASDAVAGRALDVIALRRGFLRHGGGVEPAHAAAALLTDYRRGLLGRVSLEAPSQFPAAAADLLAARDCEPSADGGHADG